MGLDATGRKTDRGAEFAGQSKAARPIDASGERAISIRQAIALHAKQRPRSPALVGQDFTPIDYAGLASFLEAAGEELAKAGLGPQSRVGLIVPPGHRGALMVLAVACHAQLAPVNPALKPAEFVEEVRRVAIDAIIAPVWLETPLVAALGVNGPTVVRASLDDDLRLSLASSGAAHRDLDEVTADSIALLLRSSGTTGEPKQIPVTHRNLLAMANKMAGWFDITPADRIPCTLPLYYAAGLKTTLFVPLFLGASVGMPAPGRTYDVCDWIEEIAPTILSVAPTSLRGLIDKFVAAPRRPSLSSLRFAICGAAYLADDLRREAEDVLGVPVLEYYGLSEAGAMAANPAPPRRRKPGTVGLPPPGELVLIGEGGVIVPQGEVGEITLSGPSVTPGYVTAQSRTPTGVESGWLSTGDLGRLDDDGYLTIVGRLKEIINRGGEKVSPYEVEKALLRHPAVEEAGVFGVPHPRLGEAVAAAVVLRRDARATPEEIRASLEQQLVPFKIPQSITILDALPHGTTGKLMRAELARQFSHRAHRSASQPDRILEHQIMAVWTRLLKRSDFGIDDDFFALGGDSLLAAEMLTEVESLVHERFPQRGLSSLTIRHMADVLTSALPCNNEALTLVREGDTRSTPFLYCHGDYLSRGLYAQRLADLITPNSSVFLLNNFPDMPFGKTAEEIATRYAEEVARSIPPCTLAVSGYCNGGLIAWHLAHLLERKGYKVKPLILVDVPSINGRPRMRWIGNLLRAAPIPAALSREILRALWYRTRGVASLMQSASDFLRRRLKPPHRHRSESDTGFASNYAPVHRAYFKMMSGYVPRTISAKVVCIIASETTPSDNNPSAWSGLCAGVTTIRLDGTHYSIVTSARETLAAAINGVLEEPKRVDEVSDELISTATIPGSARQPY